MTFGFGLEQVSTADRSELLKRSLNYLLPTTPDTTAPTIVGFKWPAEGFTATPADPVEADVTAYDNSGDMEYVNLYADGRLVGTSQVFPFQFRYTPPIVGDQHHGHPDRGGRRQGREQVHAGPAHPGRLA